MSRAQRPVAGASTRCGSDHDDLLRRIGTGDREAYGQFYRATRALVFTRVRAVVRDPGYAEETCHEVYLQVWRSAAAFDSTRGNALTWLCALAHHQAVDRVRRERIAYGYENQWGVNDYRRPADVVSEEIVRRHDEHAVRMGLTALTQRQRESVVLAFYGGLTYRQVAARLGIGEPAAKERIRSGLAHLRTALMAVQPH
ncbi:sigma-70 family RNA polymerase sigma factor [Nocardia sp. NPDC050406]|uniref:sigma-70 family RNA polymerase sigma factor n=1 Tax=Nocardia sp. NPDC050406 TaxID=3364318 RepID=UPI0037B0C837